jgi:predicted RND superfamily exporter protein
MLNSFLDGLAHFVIRFRMAAILGVTLFVVAMGIQLRNLQADFSPQDLHTTFADQKAVAEEFAEVFGKTENVLLVLLQAEDVLERGLLQYGHDLARGLSALEGIERVESLTTTSFAMPAGEGTLRVGAIVRDSEVTEANAEELRRAIAMTPLVQGNLVAEDQRLAAIVLFLPDDVTKAAVVRPVVERVEAYLDTHLPPDGATVTLGGLPHIRVWVSEKFKTDQVLLVPLSLAVCFFILFLSFRWAPGVVFPGLAVIFSSVLTVGAMAALGEPINIINQVVPILIIIIGISDSIHLVSRFREEYGLCGDSKEAARRTLRFMAVACLLTSATTAVGFGSLAVSRTSILVRFGVTAAIGVMLAYIVTIFLLPPLLSYTRPKARPETLRADAPPSGVARTGLLEEVLARLMRWILPRPVAVVAGSVAFLGLSVYVASLVSTDSFLNETFREGDEVYQTMVLVEEELDGILPLEISFRGEERARLNAPEVLNEMYALARWLEEQPGVLSATSYADYLRQARVAYHDDPSRREREFRSVAEVSQLAALLEGGNPSPLEPWVTLDARRARLNVQIGDLGAHRTIELSQQIQAQLHERFDRFEDLEVVLTGSAFVASAGISSLVKDMFSSLLTAFAIIFVLMAVLFRSLRMGLISVPPNLIPLAVTMAYMTVAGISLNTTTVVCFAISIGLAVDHTIHMMARFQEERAAGHDVDNAIIGAARGTGRAIVVTSVTLFVGMCVLLLSSFVPVAQFATLLAVTALATLVGNLVMLPALLRLAVGRGVATSRNVEVEPAH